MDILTFLATVLPALAWPLLATCGLLMFRKPLRELLVAFPQLQLRYKEFELHFSEDRVPRVIQDADRSTTALPMRSDSPESWYVAI